MSIYIITVDLAIDVPDDARANDPIDYMADAINEILRPHQADFAMNSALADYRIPAVEVINTGMTYDANYVEGSAFKD